MEMQSSPVPIPPLEIFTLFDLLMWIPSVFGLSAGAVIRRLYSLTLLLFVTATWNPLLSTEESLLTIALLTESNFRFWSSVPY